jgi:isoleucyl-tRNA synthetase
VNIDYSLVKIKDQKMFWLAEGTRERVLKDLNHKVIEKKKGRELLDLSYKSAFDELPAVKKISNDPNFHKVIATDDLIMPISEEEGTGLVHTAVSAGTEDFNLGRKLGLPMIPVIDDSASYIDGFGFLSGENAKNNPRLILDFMEKEGFAFKIENYTHRYPACWRCKTELVWKVTEEWYISMDKGDPTLRERMIGVAKKIKWIPAFGLERELDWLSNMHDWLISKKNRYWGLALPIWECKSCGSFDVIGSYEELKERVVEGWGEFEGKTPHKPQMDKLKIKCSKCSEVVERIEPVGNPWLDAGIVAFSTVSENNESALFEKTDTKPLYIIDKKKWRNWVPADFITESFPGQFKNWFYSLIAMSTVLEDLPPFKTVLGFATLFAEDGRPMHKSWGNSIEFNEGAEKIGVDVMRWMYVRQNPAENLLFGYKIADETRRKFHLTLWNIYNFFVTYANLDGWKPKAGRRVAITNLLDAWIVSRFAETLEKVSNSLDQYNAQSSALAIEEFVSDMSLWYIRRSRGRVSQAAENKRDKNDFYEFTYLILINLSRVLAPFMPFMADMMFRNLTKLGSVHLTDWPDKTQVNRIRDLVGSKKDAEGLIYRMGLIRKIVEKGHSERKNNSIPVRQPLNSITVYISDVFDERLIKLIEEELNVKKVIWKKGKELNVEFDTKITPELEEEAKTRELIRKIQQERKNMGILLTQKIKVTNPWLPKNNILFQNIKKIALVSHLEHGEFKITN